MNWRILSAAAVTVVLLAGCMHSHAPVPAPAASSVGGRLLALARATGAQVRVENPRGFVVYPVYLHGLNYGAPVDSLDLLDVPRAWRMHALLAAFGDGARAQFADTVALRGSKRLFFSLTGSMEIDGDTATIDVFGGLAMPADSSAQLEWFRYTFSSRAGRWVFVKRTMVWAA